MMHWTLTKPQDADESDIPGPTLPTREDADDVV